MNEKISGYILLITGILVIILASWNVYSAFTKKSEPVKLFNFQGISMDITQLATNSMQQNLPEQFMKQIKSSVTSDTANKQEIIPAPVINDPMNYMAHVFLMGFIVSAGMKIAQLGTYLIRTIDVHVKTTQEHTH